MSRQSVRDAIEARITAGRQPVAYLDANVLLDVVRGRRQASRDLLTGAPRAGWTLRSSTFALIELTKREQQARFLLPKLRRGESIDDLLRASREPHLTPAERSAVQQNIDGRLRRELRTVEWFDLDEGGWQAAFDFALENDISAPDAIHVAVASSTDCDFIVTNDSNLLTSSASVIPGCSASDALALLRELG